MRQADTTQEAPGGNRGIAIALMRRLPSGRDVRPRIRRQ
jgi:hypothetical protein